MTQAPAADAGMLLDQVTTDLGPYLDRAQAAYLGGSRAFGLDNALSDIDVTVVMADGEILPPTLSRVVGEIHTHIEFRHERDIRQLAGIFQVEHLPSSAGLPAAQDVLKHKRPVLEAVAGRQLRPSELVDEIRHLVPQERIAALASEAHSLLAAALTRDATGALRSGHLLVAHDAAIQVLEHGLDAALASRGDLYGSRKFLFTRVRRVDGVSVWFDAMWNLAFHAPAATAPPEEHETHVQAMLRAGNWLVAAALLDAIGDAAPPWATPPSPDGFVVPATLGLVRGDEGFRLVGDIELGIGPQAALLWTWAHQRTPAEIATMLVARYPDLTHADAERFCRVNLSSLERIGAILT